MNHKNLTGHYSTLTPEERFQLIVAAGSRGDDAEQERLLRVGGAIRLSMQDHAPFGNALLEVAKFVYLELLEEAHRYVDAFQAADEVEDDEHSLDLALAAGYLLRTKADGWKLFCERQNIPPFALWERLPGFTRLRGALAVSDKAAFVAEGFLRWINDARPTGAPELTSAPYTVEGFADAIESVYRHQVQRWSGVGG